MLSSGDPVDADSTAYGLRNPSDEPPVSFEGRRLRDKPLLPLAATVVGAFLLVALYVGLLSFLRVDEQGDRAPRDFFEIVAEIIGFLLHGAAALAAVMCGLWALFVPRISIEQHGLAIRAAPFRAPKHLDAADIAWRTGTRFIGRYLVTHDGRVGRVRISSLSRSDQQVLFAWLDQHAGRP